MRINEEGPAKMGELYLLDAPLAVPEEHSSAGVMAVLRKYKAGDYEELITASVNVYNEGECPDALFVPVIRFIMDASSVGLEQFDMNGLGTMQHFIPTRADVAANYAVSANRFALYT